MEDEGGDDIRDCGVQFGRLMFTSQVSESFFFRTTVLN